MKTYISRCVGSILCLLAVMTVTGYARSSQTVNYQGVLMDALGVAVDGDIEMTFAIYDMSEAGTPLWSDTLTVGVDNGQYQVLLGQTIPIDLPEVSSYWLGITIGTDPEMVPRVEIGKADPPCFDNTNRYVDCGNGTVTDTVTRLIWLKNANCFGVFTYIDAKNAVTGLQDGDCGLSDNSVPGDWRLPTKIEWKASIARADALGCTSPYLTNTTGNACYSAGPQAFIGVQADRYWSSTAAVADPNVAWDVLLGHGNLSTCHEEYTYYVWPVRGGE